MYDGTTLYTPSINIVSNVTTIEYPGNDLHSFFTVHNGPGSVTYGLPSDTVVFGTASHLTARSNVVYSNVFTGSSIVDMQSNTRATEYVGTTLVSESNGYMNVTTNSVTYDPLIVGSNLPLDVSFNVSNISLSGTYNSVTYTQLQLAHRYTIHHV